MMPLDLLFYLSCLISLIILVLILIFILLTPDHNNQLTDL